MELFGATDWTTYNIIMLVLSFLGALAAVISIYAYFSRKNVAKTRVKVSGSAKARVAGKDLTIGQNSSAKNDDKFGGADVEVEDSEGAEVGGRNVSRK